MLFFRTTLVLSLAITVGLTISSSPNAYALEPVARNPLLGQTDTVVNAPRPAVESQTFTVSDNVETVDTSRDNYTATSQAELDARQKAIDDAAAAAKQKAADAAAAAAAKEAAAAAAAAAAAKTTSSAASTDDTILPNITPDPGSAQAEGQRQVKARGWDDTQFNCLVALWNKESGWRVNASNPSGAYGIPQALPGSKMSSIGSDWQTNAATQITWGLNYIQGRYANPCGAWAHSQAMNWY